MRRYHARFALLLAGAMAITACERPETLTPEQKSERGQAMLRQMSQTLAGAKAFSYTAQEHDGRAQPGGATKTATRHVTVRRPNALAYTGDQSSAWYDGKAVTFVSHPSKVWARGPMPATMDDALDFLSAEYAVQIPTADLLYSSPYDALVTADTKGGWVDVQNVGDTACDHLAYSQDDVDWEIWLKQDPQRLPRQLTITYKTEPGSPSTTVVFSDFNPSPLVSDDTFVAKVPDGFKRLTVMRHATLEDTSVSDQAPASKDAPAPKKQE